MTSHILQSAAVNGNSSTMLIASGDDIVQQFQSYLVDESRLAGGKVSKLYFPETEEDIAEIMRSSHQENLAITISAARTGIAGGAVPVDGNLMSLEKMDAVLNIEKGDNCWLITVQPGIALDTVADCVAGKSFDSSIPGADAFNADETPYLYPVDPTERTASIGGTCATNASGARTFHFGPTRDYVQGLHIILPNGELIEISRGQYTFDNDGNFTLNDSQGNPAAIELPAYRIPAVKHAAGYFAADNMDLIDLFIGSEGTLGTISQVTLRAIPFEQEIFSSIAFFTTNEDAVQFTLQARAADDLQPLALEFFDSRSLGVLRAKKAEEGEASKLREIPDYAQAAVYFEQPYADEDQLYKAFDAWDAVLSANNSSMDNTWGGMEPAEKKMLKDFRHEVPEGVNTLISRRKQVDDRIHKVGTDMSVPDEHLLEIYNYYCEQCGNAGLEFVIFGHIGDNHLHVNILPKTYDELQKALELYKDFAVKVVAMQGSVAAEHGIGKMKKKFLPIMFGADGIEQMQAVKKALDPSSLLSPGNLF